MFKRLIKVFNMRGSLSLFPWPPLPLLFIIFFSLILLVPSFLAPSFPPVSQLFAQLVNKSFWQVLWIKQWIKKLQKIQKINLFMNQALYTTPQVKRCDKRRAGPTCAPQLIFNSLFIWHNISLVYRIASFLLFSSSLNTPTALILITEKREVINHRQMVEGMGQAGGTDTMPIITLSWTSVLRKLRAIIT